MHQGGKILGYGRSMVEGYSSWAIDNMLGVNIEEITSCMMVLGGITVANDGSKEAERMEPRAEEKSGRALVAFASEWEVERRCWKWLTCLFA